MKRSANGKAKSGREQTLIRWIKEINETDTSGMSISFPEEKMNVWNVVFHADMFDLTNYIFQFENDLLSWVNYDASMQHNLSLLRKEWDRKQQYACKCYCIGSAMYEFSIDVDGNMVQKNIATDRRRNIRFTSDSLQAQLKQWFSTYGANHTPGVHLQILFYDFPTCPPFVRVVRPRFQQWTGHITIGGSICTQMLTLSGWQTNMKPLGFLLQLRNILVEGSAKVDIYNRFDYGTQEALEAFKRVARDHAWEIPKALDQAFSSQVSER